jgi:hypothetical protein
MDFKQPTCSSKVIDGRTNVHQTQAITEGTVLSNCLSPNYRQALFYQITYAPNYRPTTHIIQFLIHQSSQHKNFFQIYNQLDQNENGNYNPIRFNIMLSRIIQRR